MTLSNSVLWINLKKRKRVPLIVCGTEFKAEQRQEQTGRIVGWVYADLMVKVLEMTEWEATEWTFFLQSFFLNVPEASRQLHSSYRWQQMLRQRIQMFKQEWK